MAVEYSMRPEDQLTWSTCASLRAAHGLPALDWDRPPSTCWRSLVNAAQPRCPRCAPQTSTVCALCRGQPIPLAMAVEYKMRVKPGVPLHWHLCAELRERYGLFVGEGTREF